MTLSKQRGHNLDLAWVINYIAVQKTRETDSKFQTFTLIAIHLIAYHVNNVMWRVCHIKIARLRLLRVVPHIHMWGQYCAREPNYCTSSYWNVHKSWLAHEPMLARKKMVRNDSKSWVIVKPYKHVYTHTGTCTPAHSYVKAKVGMGRESWITT